MSAVLSRPELVADKRSDGSSGRVVTGMRRVAMDIGEACAHLRMGVRPSEREQERIFARLREDQAWLHQHADQIAAKMARGELS